MFEPTGVADRFELASQPEWRDGFDPLPRGVKLGLEGCRWRAPGIVTYDLTWDGGREPDYPLQVPLSLTVARGDTGIGSGGVVTLREPGAFSITTDLNQVHVRPDQPSRSTWESSRYQVPEPARTGCVVHLASLSADDPQFRTLDEMSVDLVEAADGGSGTLEALAASADPFDRNDRLVALPHLLAHDDLPAIDRLFLPTAGFVNRIHVEQDGSCLSIETDVSAESPESGAASALVQQRLACPPPHPVSEEDAVVAIGDDVWDVRIIGPATAVDEMAPLLEPVFSGAIERLDATDGAFDPDAYIDAALAEQDGVTEIARFDWQDGKVAIVRRGESDLGEAFADPIVAVPTTFNAGAGGTACRDYLFHASTDGNRGFTLVVLHRPGLQATLTYPDGRTEAVPLTSVGDGRRAALIDTGATQLSPTDLTVTDGKDTAVGCDQRDR